MQEGQDETKQEMGGGELGANIVRIHEVFLANAFLPNMASKPMKSHEREHTGSYRGRSPSISQLYHFMGRSPNSTFLCRGRPPNSHIIGGGLHLLFVFMHYKILQMEASQLLSWGHLPEYDRV